MHMKVIEFSKKKMNILNVKFGYFQSLFHLYKFFESNHTVVFFQTFHSTKGKTYPETN